MNHRQPEQPNNVQFPAEPEPEYTLEEIMAEFGAPQEPTPESVPEPASEPVSEPAPEQAPEPIPEPEPEPEAEPVQPESPPPGPQQERVHVFRPVPDRRPPQPERSAPAPKPKAKKRPVQIVERPKPEPEPPTPQQALQLCSAGLGGRRARLTVSGLLMLMQLLLVCYGQFSLQFLPFLSGKLQLLLPAALLGLQMLLSADALWQGMRDLVHPSLYTPGAVLCVLALLDSVQQLSAGTPGYAAPAALVLFGLLHALTRERERGNMENLLASPVTPVEIMLGKITPYIVTGHIQVGIVLALAVFLFKVPFTGDPAALYAASVLFIAANLTVGVTISAVARNQLQAMQMTFFYFLPNIMLSGFMFPFYGMPEWAQYIGSVLPLTYFNRLVRGILLKGCGWQDIWQNLWPIAAFTAALMGVAVRAFRRTLD